MLKRINFECSALLERHDAIDAAKNIILLAGGWITDFKTYSKNMITFQFIIETDNMNRFPALFKESSITLFPESSSQLKLWLEECESKRPTIELTGYLVVYVVNDGPDVEVEVPAVPG